MLPCLILEVKLDLLWFKDWWGLDWIWGGIGLAWLAGMIGFVWLGGGVGLGWITENELAAGKSSSFDLVFPALFFHFLTWIFVLSYPYLIYRIRSHHGSGPISYPVPSRIRSHHGSGSISDPVPSWIRSHLGSGPIMDPVPSRIRLAKTKPNYENIISS